MKTIPFRRLSQRALKDEDAQRLLKILPLAFRSLREAALAEIPDSNEDRNGNLPENCKRMVG